MSNETITHDEVEWTIDPTYPIGYKGTDPAVERTYEVALEDDELRVMIGFGSFEWIGLHLPLAVIKRLLERAGREL